MRQRRMTTTTRLTAFAAALVLLPACTSGGAEDGAESAGEEDRYGLPEGAWEEIEEKAEARGPEMPEDAYLFQRLMPGGVPGKGAFAAARQQADRLERLASTSGPTMVRRPWRFEGPRNVGGRVVDAVLDPQQSDSLYVATASNGVWRSTDAGETFTSVWPDEETHAMGAIAATPDGTLYAGTGETNPGGGSVTYGGDGIYRSADEGESWERVGLENSGTIGRIVVDPEAPERIWVAASGDLFVPGGQRGIYVSEDGGDTWSESLAPPNDTTGATDIAVDPAAPDHVIVSMWDHIRQPDARVYTGIGSGVWETRDGGESWARLGESEGLQAPSEDTGRIGVAFAPSEPDQVYAIYANDETGAFENFFSSDDNGRSWSRPDGADDLTDSQNYYGWWFGKVYVDPDDADRVYALGLDLWESADAGESFESVCCMHVDQHAMVWDPEEPDRLYVGNDGGLYVSEEDGADESFTQSDDQPWSQYTNLDISEQQPDRIVGGLQDNGTVASWTDPPFEQIFGGDGGRSLINPTDPDNYYACAQYGACNGWDGDDTFELPIESDRFPFVMPMEFDPGDPSVMYAGGERLNRSTDGGRTWNTLTDDLGKGEEGDEPNPIYRGHYGTISAHTVAPSDPDTIWAGTDNGYLYRSTDGGDTWEELEPPVRDKLWISRITIDPRNADTVYLTFSGFREGDNAPYVLRTEDGGEDWENITANLPHAPVNDVIVHRGRLYVATDVGVFTAAAPRPRWFALGVDMPQLVATDLRYVPRNDRLYVSTFGMGVWSLPLGG